MNVLNRKNQWLATFFSDKKLKFDLVVRYESLNEGLSRPRLSCISHSETSGKQSFLKTIHRRPMRYGFCFSLTPVFIHHVPETDYRAKFLTMLYHCLPKTCLYENFN